MNTHPPDPGLQDEQNGVAEHTPSRVSIMETVLIMLTPDIVADQVLKLNNWLVRKRND